MGVARRANGYTGNENKKNLTATVVTLASHSFYCCLVEGNIKQSGQILLVHKCYFCPNISKNKEKRYKVRLNCSNVLRATVVVIHCSGLSHFHLHG
jgi:hypothetical protein